MEVDEKEEKDLEVYLPGKALGKDEVLEADQSVYEMLHKLNVEWPCLSFDVLQDRLGDERKTVSVYFCVSIWQFVYQMFGLSVLFLSH